MYNQTSNISRTLVGNKIVDHSDVVGALPVAAVPTASREGSLLHLHSWLNSWLHWIGHYCNYIWGLTVGVYTLCRVYRYQSVHALSQWDRMLHCNIISHWLAVYTKWPLDIMSKCPFGNIKDSKNRASGNECCGNTFFKYIHFIKTYFSRITHQPQAVLQKVLVFAVWIYNYKMSS